jgi:hypothetical protein
MSSLPLEIGAQRRRCTQLGHCLFHLAVPIVVGPTAEFGGDFGAFA